MPWRGPAHPNDFPSLGWALLDWWAEHLPSPRDPSKPLIFTDEQARQLVEWYRLDPKTGARVYRRGYSRRAKGWGKSPVEAAKAIAELAGPVRFAGWSADGEPVGRPWGYEGDPLPWVQIGAVSEDQTDNTWSVLHYLLTENDGRAADALRIDAGLTRCLMRDRPGAKAEPVTAAAGSREGQPTTYNVLDESHLMTRSNGGVKLAATMRRNAAKIGGTSYETTNSFEIGKHSVAESSFNAVRKGAPGVFADEIEAPREIGGIRVDLEAPDKILRAALQVAYGDSWWVDLDRLVADARDPSNEWADTARFFFNWNMADGAGWQVVPRDAWQSCYDVPGELADKGCAGLAVGPGQQWAALGFFARRADGRGQIEVARHEAGTQWIVNACSRAHADTGRPIIVDPKTPTSGVLQALTDAGVPYTEISTPDLVAASGQFQRLVLDGQIVQLGASSLTDAVRAASSRPVGEAWVLSANKSDGDITPAQSVVLAAWGAATAKTFEFFVY